MNSKLYLLFGSAFCLFLTGCSFSETAPENVLDEEGQIVNEEGSQKLEEKVQNLYQAKKAAGINMEDGPCLGEIDGWAVDIVHNPRLPIDNRPENQCADFRNGNLEHFVELDPEGNIIRIQ